jgi:hypothetical protein
VFFGISGFFGGFTPLPGFFEQFTRIAGERGTFYNGLALNVFVYMRANAYNVIHSNK